MIAVRWMVGCLAAMTLSLGLIGCGSSSSSSSGSGGGTSMDALAGQVDAQNAAKKQQESVDAAKNAAAAAQAAADRQAAEAKAMADQKKAVGSREVVAGGGYYSAIIGARRHVMNVVDNISWIQGVRNFQATYGRKPKDTKEFMNVCVKENDLQLPRIEADEEYLYDPNGESDGNFGQLYVVKKQSASEPAAPGGTTPGAPSAAK
jgi:hypothetical protein